MAATFLSSHSSENFQEFSTFNQNKIPPTGFSFRGSSPPALCANTSGIDDLLAGKQNLTSQLSTPDSGFVGAASSTLLKTPDSQLSSSTTTPLSSFSGQRKRKTVTIDESQTSVVVISRAHLFRTYAKSEGRRENLQGNASVTRDLESNLLLDALLPDPAGVGILVDRVTGWPLIRSESLESRENPFIPGGELSREAEHLISRATIIRDNFYLNEDEKRALLEQHQQQPTQHQNIRNNHTLENPYDHVDSSNTSISSPPDVTEEKERSSSSPLLSVSEYSNESSQVQPRENGKARESITSTENVKLTIPSDESMRPPGSGQTFPGEDLHVQDADIKQRNKCCSLM